MGPQNEGLRLQQTWYLGWDVGQAIVSAKRMYSLLLLSTPKLSVEYLFYFIFLHIYIRDIGSPTRVLWD